MTPDQFTLKEDYLNVGDGHKIYSHLWGNDSAKETIIFLHGGPGSGCSDSQKGYFDPSVNKVLFFDQRGCGKSMPYGSLKNNTTDDLINDISKLADHYDINKFVLTGGSWGSCLALAYAIENPERVSKLVIRGVFTGSKKEIDFLDKGEFANFFPEVWGEFVSSVPSKYKADPMSFHEPRILGKDKAVAKESAYLYNKLEGSLVSLDDRTRQVSFEEFDPIPTIIECYYIANHCFFKEDEYILKNASQLTMPVTIVQGRYDMVCPPLNAFNLSMKLANCKLLFTAAGHSGHDRASWDLIRSIFV